MKATTPTFVCRVDTDICAGPGRPPSVDLGPRTVLLGRNGIGKTRITRSLGLALTSEATDLLGKGRVKAPADVLLTAPQGQGSVAVRLAFAVDGESWADATYQTAYTDRGKAPRAAAASRPEEIDSEWVLPVRTVHSWLMQGPAKAREAFVPYIAGTVTAQDIRRALPGVYVDPSENGSQTPATVSALVEMLDLAGTRKREEDRSSKGARDHADSMTAQITEAEPSDERMKLAEAALNHATRVLEVSARSGATALLAQKQAQLTECERTIDQQAPNPGVLSPRPAGGMDVRTQGLFDHLDSGVVHAKAIVDLGLKRCPSCGEQGLTMAKIVAWEAQIDVWRQQAQGDPAVLQREVALWQQQQQAHAAAVQNRAQADAFVARLRSEVRVLEQQAQTTSLDDNPDAPMATALPLEQARAAHESAQAVVRALTALRGTWDSIREARNLAVESARLAEWWKGYATALQGVVKELLDASLNGFVDTVQRYMPRGKQAALVLRDDTGRNVFKLGLVEGGNLNLAPSGAEWAMLLFAITAAVLDRLPDGPPSFALFMLPEERSFDPYTAGDLMRALRGLPYQIVLTLTVKPKRAPKEWLVLDLDEKAKALLAQVEVEPATEEGVAKRVAAPEVPSADRVHMAQTTLETLDPGGDHRPWHESEDACKSVHEALMAAGHGISLAAAKDIVEAVERRLKASGGRGPRAPEAHAK